MKIITIFGGSGFIGTELTKTLIESGFVVNIITRDPNRNSHLKTIAGPDYISIKHWCYQDLTKIDNLIEDSFAVIYLVGLLFEEKDGDFSRLQHQIPLAIAKAIKSKVSIKKTILLSALGVDKVAKSRYCQTKLLAEKEIKSILPNITIIRPSIVFGCGDNFLNRFASQIKTFPLFVLINHGRTKFQPIFVKDLVFLLKQILLNDEHSIRTTGRTYEVSGPKLYNFKDLVLIVAKALNIKVYFISIPFFLAKILAYFLEFFTKKILTCDQVEILKYNNIASEQNFINDFPFRTKKIEEVIEQYIKKVK
jgi:uncharacterized protein YbjT (DUF2867 family)